jgi:hypothetical protein
MWLWIKWENASVGNEYEYSVAGHEAPECKMYSVHGMGIML